RSRGMRPSWPGRWGSTGRARSPTAAPANTPYRVARGLAHRLIRCFDADLGEIAHHVFACRTLSPGRAVDCRNLAIEPIEAVDIGHRNGGLQPFPLVPRPGRMSDGGGLFP